MKHIIYAYNLIMLLLLFLPNSIQIQSYLLEDVIFQDGARFKPCIENVRKRNKDTIRIDLDRFHEIDHVTINKRTRSTRTWQRSVRGHDGIFFQKKPK
jgi:hypothetical protein